MCLRDTIQEMSGFEKSIKLSLSLRKLGVILDEQESKLISPKRY